MIRKTYLTKISMKVFAKYNLLLKVFPRIDIISKKHYVKTLMCTTSQFFDTITINKQEGKLSINYFDKKGNPIFFDNCLVTKAVLICEKIFKKKFFLDISITKGIPIAAGLGGGSADAGYIIKWILRTYNLKITRNDLLLIARYVGSDVPFFISDFKVAEVSGIGDTVKKVSFNHPCKIHLNNISSSTKTIYSLLNAQKRYQSRVSYDSLFQLLKKRKFVRGAVYNDLEPYVIAHTPTIKALLAKHKHAIVCGSGNSIITL